MKTTAIKNLVLMSLTALTFTGCEDFQGKLTVYSTLAIKNQHILNRTVTYTPGTYKTKLVFHDVLNVIELESDGHKAVDLKIPHEFVNSDGDINLSASASGEAFDAKGSFKTYNSDSPSVPGTASCVLGSHEEYSGTDGNGNPVYTTVTDWGTQSVMEHTHTTSRVLRLSFTSPDTGTVLADLNGDDTNAFDVIDQYTSSCR